jgi:Peptidase inhibitor I78 family
MADQPEATKPPKKEKTIEDILNRDNQMMRSPILWFFLLGLPVVLCFYVAFANEDVGPAKEPPKVIEHAPDGAVGAPAVYDKNAAHRRDMATPCDFNEWMGKPADAALEAAIKPLNRPYRILPPGSMMTKDFSPSRINFDLNESGKIIRAWCG